MLFEMFIGAIVGFAVLGCFWLIKIKFIDYIPPQTVNYEKVVKSLQAQLSEDLFYYKNDESLNAADAKSGVVFCSYYILKLNDLIDSNTTIV